MMEASQIVEFTRALGLPACLECKEIIARRDKSIWRVTCAADIFAVRVFRPREHESARHEREMMTVAREAGLPVAAVRGSGTIEDRPALLVDWRSGHNLLEELRARPWAARELGQIFGEQQARMHAAASRINPSNEWIGFFGDVDARLRDRLERGGRDASLIHLDYHPENIVAGSHGISAILDWTNARFGDRRADLARTWSCLRFIFRPGRRHPVQRLAHDVFTAAWWRGYTDLTGPQREMSLFRVWAIEGLLRISRNQPSSKRGDLIRLARLSADLRCEAQLPTAPVEELLRTP
jgi:Ser/Thr protein kinase RdoA (MazF antagonist)